MGMITLIVNIVALAKSLMKKQGAKRHCRIGLLALVTAVIHAALTIVATGALTAPVVTGLICLVFILLLGLSYGFRKKLGKKWKLIHRLLALGLALLIVGHLAV